MTNLKRKFAALASLSILLTFGACASSQKATKVSIAGDEKNIVEVTADSFNFNPSIIEIKSKDTIFLKITNISSSSHNFTVKNPAGEVIQNVELPPNKTITLEVNFKKPGTYEFYCDKPFHGMLGMKGRFEVIAAN